MTDVKEDISDRISGHIQSQVAKNEQKHAEAGRKTRRNELQGPAAYATLFVALLVIAGSVWYGWESTRPPGFVRLLDYSEKMVDGKPMLVGKVTNSTRHVLQERTWIVTYTDITTPPPKIIVEASLVLSGVPPGETSEWAVEIPGWREGLKRTVRPKR